MATSSVARIIVAACCMWTREGGISAFVRAHPHPCFAVVATEVRNLAQRSASAAKEIKSLIGDSVEKVETGSKLVSQAGSTMDEIVSSVKRVTDIMGKIASASGEHIAPCVRFGGDSKY